MKKNRLLCRTAMTLLLYAITARAQDASDGSLHVLRPVIHAEQEDAELCLEFDHDLDAADHSRIASAIKLDLGEKTIPVRQQNISVVNNLLCLPSLEHHRQYRIVVAGLRGKNNEKLANTYGLDFTVPDRRPMLSFTGDAASEGLMRWQDSDPVLRSINVSHVQLELYRITDPAMMVAAWRERHQTTLAPSESATFGHDHGEKVWSGNLVLGKTMNRTVEQVVPLRTAVGVVPKGLYLVVARAPEVKAQPGTEQTTLAVTAAAWLSRSDLSMQAIRDKGGFFGLAEKANSAATLGNVRILAEDANSQILAETRSDANGIGFLSLTPDKINNATVLAAFTDYGDVDFVDLSSSMIDRFIPPENQTSLTMDKPFYFLASTAQATLVDYNAQGQIVAKPGSTVTITWPDGHPYMSIPVSIDPDGISHLSFSAPGVAGVWTLIWCQPDGTILARSTLRVTPDPDAPRFEMSADRTMISRDGNIDVTIKSVSGNGRPSPYMAGRVLAAWSSPDNLFREWKGYHFGNSPSATSENSPLMSFITNEKGIASLRMTLIPPDDHALLHNAILSAQTDASAGVEAPAPLTLPLKPKEEIIGIKSLSPDGRFPENGSARFSVVALDNEGHRRNADDLTYQVYEEGRSFDWYQSDGRWNYKPLQQKRRIGGGALTLGTDSEDVIEWPVAAGTYRLEITDANGSVRSSINFSAGWGLPEIMPSPLSLNLTPAFPEWTPGQEMQIRFKLDKPAMISAFIGDDHIRKIIHQFMPAGDNNIAFVPEKDWKNRINLQVDVENLNLAGKITLHRAGSAEDVAKINSLKNASVSEILTPNFLLPAELRIGDTTRIAMDFFNNEKTPESLHYTLNISSGLKVTDGVAVGSVTIPAGQSRKIYLGIDAVHPGSSSVKLDIAGPAHFHSSREWIVPIMSDEFRLDAGVRQRIEPQQSTSWPPGEKGHAKDNSILFLSASPLYGAPTLLAHILQSDPYTTREIAGALETARLWRGIIIAADLMPEMELDLRERNMLFRLLARQKPDGSFSSLPGDKADFVSTSQAVIALTHNNQSAAKPAMEQAIGWLRQRLENSWFDEHEISERAAAFAALAEANHLDNASLHYFSDTSARKTVPPLAATQLAYAFAKIGDQPASSFWIDTSGVKKDLSSFSPAIALTLAGNGFFDPQSLSSSLDAISGKSFSANIESTTQILRTVWLLQNRKGSWHVMVNTDKRNPKDILVVPVAAKTAIPIIHNTGNDPIFLAGTQKIESTVSTAHSIARHIYQLNGTEVGGHKPLEHGETYLVVLEGSWSGGDGESLFLHDDLNPALHVTGCLPPAPIEADDSLAWLKSQTVTNRTSCETSEDGIDMLLTRKDNENKESNGAASWRAAYLAKAIWPGSFTLQPPVENAFVSGYGEIIRPPSEKISGDHIEIH